MIGLRSALSNIRANSAPAVRAAAFCIETRTSRGPRSDRRATTMTILSQSPASERASLARQRARKDRAFSRQTSQPSMRSTERVEGHLEPLQIVFADVARQPDA